MHTASGERDAMPATDTTSALFHTLPASTTPVLHTNISGVEPFTQQFMDVPLGLRPISTKPSSTSGPASSTTSQGAGGRVGAAAQPGTQAVAAPPDDARERSGWGERFAQLFSKHQAPSHAPALQSVEYPLQTCDSPLHEPVYACSPQARLLNERRRRAEAPGLASVSLDTLAAGVLPRRTHSGISQTHSAGRLGVHSLQSAAALPQGGSARGTAKHTRIGSGTAAVTTNGSGGGRSSGAHGASERLPFGRAPVEPQGIAVADCDWLRCSESMAQRSTARGSGDLAAQSELSMASTAAGRPFLPLPPPMASDGELCMDAHGNFIKHFPARRLEDAPACVIGPSAA